MDMKNIKDSEILFGDKKINSDTIIQLNLKTLVVLLSFIVSTATTAWWNLKTSIDSNNQKTFKDIEKLSDEIKSIKEQDLKTISIQLNQVDGKVQGIFLNLQRSERPITNNIISTPIDTIVPSLPNRN
jgi:hypothetical protein